jgi:Ion channel
MMAETDSTKPRAIERWLEGKLPGYRFGLVLLFLLMTFVFMASGITGSWVRVVTVALQGLTLLAALRASEVRRRTFRIAALVALVAFVSSLVSVALSSSQDTTAAFFALNILIVAGAPIAIGRALWRRPVVDIHTVLGAICVYVLVGMLFAFLYSAVGYFGADPFFVQTSDATTSEYLYFSFVTLTTVGYGDFTAAEGLGRSLASLEGLVGQVYLVTVVAILVSRMAPRASRVGNQPASVDLGSPEAG